MYVSIRSNKGFSLVELMVVVAIIGILAAIAVPNYQRFSAKSKQAEAKANLSAVYSAEKAFISEWQTYNGSFLVVGFKPDGFLKYRLINFATGNNLPANYPTNPAYAANDCSTATYCGANAIGGAGGCAESVTGGVGVAAPVGAVATMNANAFVSTASSILQLGLTSDTWTISDTKVINNPTSGLP